MKERKKEQSPLKERLFFITEFFLLCMILVLTALLMTVVFSSFTERNAEKTSATADPVFTVILDAGHGGMDGGTTSARGLLEKDLNLDIALKLQELLELSGIRVIMTRSDDSLLATDADSGHKKQADLRNRLAVMKENPGAIFVSIHMNSFPIAKYRGLQVYYSANEKESEYLASILQDYAKNYCDPDNDRGIKQAGSSIYLLDHAVIPAVLVECGFLSNPEEAALLGTESYRMKLACTLYAALHDYFLGEITTDSTF